jgi:hypothetical protein
VRDADVVSEREALALGILNEGPAVGMRVGARVAGTRVGTLVVGMRVGARVVGKRVGALVVGIATGATVVGAAVGVAANRTRVSGWHMGRMGGGAMGMSGGVGARTWRWRLEEAPGLGSTGSNSGRHRLRL